MVGIQLNLLLVALCSSVILLLISAFGSLDALFFVFNSETEQGIFEQVMKGDLDFISEPWPSISNGAKDLVKKMLVRDPKKRLTAHQVLCEFRDFKLLKFLLYN